MHILIPTTCDYVIVHGNKDLVDVIRLRILRWDNCPGLSRWAQHNHKGGRRVTLGERDVTTEAEVTVRKNNLKMLPLWPWRWRKEPQAKENSSLQKTNEARKRFLSGGLQKEPALATSWLQPSETHFGFLTFRTIKEEICVVYKPLGLW